MILISCGDDDRSITISFETNGGSLIEPIINESAYWSTFKFPDDPVKDKMFFDGWYYDKNFTNPVDESSFAPSSSITLYACWVNIYSLSLIESPYLGLYFFLDHNNNLIDHARSGQNITLTMLSETGYTLSYDTFLIQTTTYQNIEFDTLNMLPSLYVISFIMPAEDVIVTISSEIGLYTIETEIESGAADIILTHQSAKYNESVSFIIYPESGYYYVSSVLIANIAEFAVQNNSFIMPDSDVVLKVKLGTLQADNILPFTTSITGEGTLQVDENSLIPGAYINIKATAAEGWYLNQITVNDIQLSSFLQIPTDAESITIKALFEPVNQNVLYTVNCMAGEFGNITVDKVRYYAGEHVTFNSNPVDSYELDSIIVNDIFYSYTDFIMPKSNIVIKPVFKPIKHLITIDDSVSDQVFASESSACLNQEVYLNITPDLNMQLKSLYVNDIELSTNFFKMPNEPVKITALFEESTASTNTTYTILPFDDFVTGGRATLIPNKYSALLGEQISVALDYSGNLKVLAMYYHTTSGNYQILENTFVMPDSNVELLVSFSQSPDIKEYNLIISDDAQSIISTEKSLYITGSPVIINIANEYSAKISSIYYYNLQTKVEVPLVFNMPASNILLYVDLKSPDQTNGQIDLYNFYTTTSSKFYDKGLFVSYYDRFTNIEAVLIYYDLIYYVNSVLEILKVTGFGSDFVCYNMTNSNEAVKLAQFLYLKTYPQNNSIGVIDNLVIQSSQIDYNQVYNILLSGLESLNNYVIFKQDALTYAIFAYIGKASIISIPSRHNGLAITSLLSHAFDSNNNITALNLGTLLLIESGAFDALIHLVKIDLSNIESMPDDLLRYCMSLDYVYVDSRNKYYASVDGILYKKSGLTILRYPPKKSGNTFVANTVQQTLATIGDYAFYGATGLVYLDLTGISTIGNYAFQNCTSLKGDSNGHLTLSTVVTIGTYAFYNCPEIIKFSIPRLGSVSDSAFKVDSKQLTIEITNTMFSRDVTPVAFTELTRNNITILTTISALDSLRKSKTWASLTDRVRLSTYEKDCALILFESDGSYVNSIINHDIYTPLSKLSVPVYEGYTFMGWFVDKDKTIPLDYYTAIISYMQEANVLILYALFVKNDSNL
jgi:hypothetical protein